jgi:hypothetical protein
MKYLLATALAAIVAAIGAGVASASSSTYFPSSTMYGTSWSSTSPGYYSTTYSTGFGTTIPVTSYGYPSYSTPSYTPSYTYRPSYTYTPSYRVPSLPSYSGYGAISTTTGLPRTHWVNGYYRANGTYVNGYWRSCSYCR